MFSSRMQSKQFRLGELLIEKGLISDTQLTEAIALQKQSAGKQLGQILIDYGYISERQLRKALRRQGRLRLFAAVMTFWLSLFGGATGALASTTSTTSTTTTTSATTTAEALNITSQPTNAIVWEGQTQSFSVAATSTKPLIYAWSFNGVKVGSNSSTLTLTNITTANGGTYSCTVTDGTTTRTCSPFTVTVNKIARITKQPTSLLVNEGTWQRISVSATGTGPLSYQWFKNGSALTGATSPSITFKSITAKNAGSFYCVVKNGGSTATSTTATIKILSVPTSYSVRLTWAQPALREDGKALTASEISGYNLYYSNTSSGTMSKIATLSPADLSYFANGLSAGTHYFSASTVDTNGLESELSPRVAQTIQ